MKENKVFKGSIVVFVITAISFMVFSQFDVPEKLVLLSEDYEIDELVSVVIVFAACMIIFSIWRLREKLQHNKLLIRKNDELVRKLSKVIEQSSESILITNSEGIIEYVNSAFVGTSGYTAEEAIGQSPKILNSGSQDTEFYNNLWETIKNGEGWHDGESWHGKIINKKKDGSFYPAMLSISPILDASESITHYVASHANLTDLEEMEKRFYKAQKMEEIGTLVGGIAHDFNNILAAMTGNLYLAKKKSLENPCVMLKLESVEKLVFRAAGLIKQLLAFARKDIVRMEELLFTSLIKDEIDSLRTSIPESIGMPLDICTATLFIKGDDTQLRQVLMNLVNNARDAVEGVNDPQITIRLEPFEPDDAFIKAHTYFKSLPYAHLSVIDNGCGISKEHISKLFEPFFTAKEQGKGSGLGLSMVFGAIKTHHGYVEVESTESKGSAFHIYIPLLKQEETAPTPLTGEGILRDMVKQS